MSTFRNEHRVSHFKLYQTVDGGTRRVVGDNTISFIDSGFGKDAIFGLNSASVKYGGQFVEVKVSMPIHRNMVQEANELNTNSVLHRLFRLDAKWEIEFGWSTDFDNSFKISQLRLSDDFGIEYDAENRIFSVNLNFLTSGGFVLRDIPLYLLTETVERLRKTNDVSLGAAVSELLDACIVVVNAYGVDSDYAKSIEKQRRTLSQQREEPVGEHDYLITAPNIYQSDTSGEITNVDILNLPPEDNGINISHVLLNANVKDIPLPEDIRILSYEKDGDSKGATATAFIYDIMDKKDSYEMITKSEHKNVSVMAYIESFLRENGFTLMITFSRLNKTGAPEWMIIPTDYNTEIDSMKEREYINIRPSDPISPVTSASGDDKIVSTYEKDPQGNRPFDLHSNKSVVSSINASTSNGETSIGSIQATQGLVSLDQTAKVGEGIVAHRNTIYTSLSQMAKNIELECIGLPTIKIFDNVLLYLAGDLYSGKYKIYEMEHKFEDVFITSLNLSQIDLPKLNDEDQVKELPAIEQAAEKIKDDPNATSSEQRGANSVILDRRHQSVRGGG